MTDQGRSEAAARLRRLGDRLSADDLDDAALTRLIAHLDAAAGVFPPSVPARTGFARGFTEAARHPIAEGTSATFPPFELEITDGRLTADISFGPAWEGPPDLVHGGYLAAGFDMVLSAMAHHVLGHSVTRRLQVRYLKPTFLTAKLRYEVEADQPEGRLLDLRGRLLADGQVTMRASAQFATLDVERFADRRPS